MVSAGSFFEPWLSYHTMDKLTGLAALFGPEGVTGNRSLSVEAANGICMILEDCARDLDQIERKESPREKFLEEYLLGHMGTLATADDGLSPKQCQNLAKEIQLKLIGR